MWQAAFVEPLACSVHAVELGGVGFRDTVVVAGCGPLGLGMVATARLKSPASLIALDLYDWKVKSLSLSISLSLLGPCSWKWPRSVEPMWF